MKLTRLAIAVGVTLTTRSPAGTPFSPSGWPRGMSRSLDSLRNGITSLAEAPFEPGYGLNVFGFWRVDTPGHGGGDYNQRALERALARQQFAIDQTQP